MRVRARRSPLRARRAPAANSRAPLRSRRVRASSSRGCAAATRASRACVRRRPPPPRRSRAWMPVDLPFGRRRDREHVQRIDAVVRGAGQRVVGRRGERLLEPRERRCAALARIVAADRVRAGSARARAPAVRRACAARVERPVGVGESRCSPCARATCVAASAASRDCGGWRAASARKRASDCAGWSKSHSASAFRVIVGGVGHDSSREWTPPAAGERRVEACARANSSRGRPPDRPSHIVCRLRQTLPIRRRHQSRAEQVREQAAYRAGGSGLCSSGTPLASIRASSSAPLSPDTSTAGVADRTFGAAPQSSRGRRCHRRAGSRRASPRARSPG